MEIQTGYIYHIKDEFFDKINGKGLMINHEKVMQDLLILQLKIMTFCGLFK